jgi:predicted PurR-regulated permease PerM
MSRTVAPPWQQALIGLSGTVIALLLAGVLYWARAVLLPLAMAVFLAFVLSPVVRKFRRNGFPKAASVLATVALAAVIAIGIGVMLTQQIASLTLTLPDNQDRIIRKVAAIKGQLSGRDADRMGRFFDEVGRAVDSDRQPRGAQDATPVVVEPETPRWAGWVNRFVSPAAEALGQAAFAAVLVIFILFRKEDLRDRLIRLIGDGRVAMTTQALDDASERVSRYLLKQFTFNAVFGSVIAASLYFLGIHYALLWGFLAAVMRYVPYLGTWIAVIPPFLYAVAVTDAWWQPIGVLVVMIGLELVCNNFIEPIVYGQSLGVSEVAQLVAAGFWLFLWGPIGLILSGPLTTCLLVLGKHVPALKFLDVLLGDDPPLDPGMMLFQRLTARDEDEAGRVLVEGIDDRGLDAVLDDVVVPALQLIKTAEIEGTITEETVDDSLVTVRELLYVDNTEGIPSNGDDRTRVLIAPGKDELDKFACELFAQSLPVEKWAPTVTDVSTLTSELTDRIAKLKPGVLVIGSIPPGGVSHARYLCKRIRGRFPGIKLVVGRWGDDPSGTTVNGLFDTGADTVTTTLAQTRHQLTEWLPVLEAGEAESPSIRPSGPILESLAGAV